MSTPPPPPPLDGGGGVLGVGTVYDSALTYPLRFNTLETREKYVTCTQGRRRKRFKRRNLCRADDAIVKVFLTELSG